MKKLILSTLSIVLILTTLSAQNNVQVKIIDSKTDTPLEFAAARLLQVQDSALIVGHTSDSTGIINFQKVKSGTYILQASMVGYTTYHQNIEVKNKDIKLNDIRLNEDSKVLKDLQVQGSIIEMINKGDTIEYNAGAFKTSENAVVEELLKQMPGIEITEEGKIMVNGEEVKRIRVDGKKFFGDDKEMATKNIPANMIDRVQVIDQKSEMAQLTGFDDGDTERIINLTLRSDRRQGMFGNVQLGAGADINPEFRYDGNAFLNIMSGDLRSTLTTGANNTNTARSGRGRGGFGGGGGSGITETQNFGYNLNNEINKNLILGGDVTFNHSNNTVESESNRENYMQGGTFTNISSRVNQRENYAGNIRFEMEWKPDSATTIILQPNIGMTQSRSNSLSEYLYLSESDSTSWGNSRNSSKGHDLNGGLTLTYNRKFSKPGRTFTARANSSYSESVSDGFNYSLKDTPDSTVILDQRNNNLSNTLNWGLRMSFVEALGDSRHHFLESVLSFNGNKRTSERSLFDLDNYGEYTIKNLEYSNVFDNLFFRETAELNYRFVQESYNITTGMSVEPSQTYSETVYGNDSTISVKNEVINFAPNARFQYNFGRRNYARLDYRGRTNQPSVSQMQPVKNNTDLMNETVGNMGLKPAFSHTLRLMYSNNNSETMRSYSVGLNGGWTKDNLTNNSIYDNTGKRYIQTINAKEMPYNLSAHFMYSQPFFKKLNFSNNTTVSMNQRYSYTSKNINIDDIDLDNLLIGDLSSTVQYSASENISLRYNHKVFDVSGRGGLRYSNTLNNFNNKATETYDWTGSFTLGLRPTDYLTLRTNVNYTKRSGYANFNPAEWLWNATIDYVTFKKKGIFSLRMVDILQQRQNISQSVGGNSVEFSRSNSLPSYFILSFTYRINKFAGGSQRDREEYENRENRMPGRGGGGMRGGGFGGGGMRIEPMPIM